MKLDGDNNNNNSGGGGKCTRKRERQDDNSKSIARREQRQPVINISRECEYSFRSNKYFVSTKALLLSLTTLAPLLLFICLEI